MRARNAHSGLIALVLVVAVVLASGLAFAPGVATAQAQQKQKKKGGNGGPPGGGRPTGIPATVTMWDIPGDGVTSDGSSYGNGGDLAVTVDGANDVGLDLGGGRTLTFDFTNQNVAPSCTDKGPNACKCSALAGSTIATSAGQLKVNIDTGSVKGPPSFCDMTVGETMGAAGDAFNVRAQAVIGSCFVTWNAIVPATPPASLDGLTVTRDNDTSWTVSSLGTGRAWLWSDGKRGVARNNEGVFDMPFGMNVQVTQACAQ